MSFSMANWGGAFAPPLRAPCELLSRPRLELEPKDRLVADDPRVMTRLDDVRVARTDLLLGAVVVDNAHRARLQNTDVPHLTALASHDRLDRLRPVSVRAPTARFGRNWRLGSTRYPVLALLKRFAS